MTEENTQDAPFMAVDIDQFKRSFLDVPYASVHERQKLDIVLPETGEGPFPVIVAVHGGAWKFRFKRADNIKGLFQASSQGYAVAAIGYRLSGDAQWPAQVNDVKAALIYLREHAEEYHLDPSCFIICGNSSGAHLSLTVASTNGDESYEDRALGGPGDASVQGCFSMYGVSDLYVCETQTGHRDDGDNPMSCPDQVMGFSILEEPIERCDAASPVKNILRNPDSVPPMLIQHGTGDPVVPFAQSVALYETLQGLGEGDCVAYRSADPHEEYMLMKDHLRGKRAVLELVEGAGHGADWFKTSSNMDRFLDFADEVSGIDRAANPRTPLPEIKLVPSYL